MAAFMSGLLGGLGGGLLDRERQQHEDKVRDAESRKRILETVMNNPDTRPEDKQAILKILISPGGLDQPKGKGKGKGKGNPDAGNPLHDFLDRLSGLGSGGGGIGTPPFIAPGMRAEGSPPPPVTPQSLTVPPMPSQGATGQPGATEKPETSQPTGKPNQALSVPAMPQQGIFKTQAEKDQEEIDRQKRYYQEVVKPEKEEERKALEEHEDKLIKAGQAREDAKLQAAQDREDARQHALDTRMKLQEGFQLEMEGIKERAAENRERIRDAAQLRLTDAKTADVIDKQGRIERQKNVSETLKSLQQQITTATGLLKSREAEAQKQSWWKFWQDSPDTKSAQEDIDNAKSALAFLTDHKTAVIEGKENMDEVTAKTEDILRNGQPTWSQSNWVKEHPGKDVTKAALLAKQQGLQVVP